MQEIIVHSWAGRVFRALISSLLGLVCLCGAFALVFWNEGHGLHSTQALREIEQALVSVQIAPINPQNNLRPVYFTGLAATSGVLRDSLLDISQQAILLMRTVEMYQWEQAEETQIRKKIGGSVQEVKTYTYHPRWSKRLIRSDLFKEAQSHQNPIAFPFQSRTLQAKIVKVGDFYLPPFFVQKMKGLTILDLSRLNLAPLQQKIKRPVRHLDYSLYVGENPQKPQIGDLKITVAEILPQTVSIIAQQVGTAVQPYLASSGQSVALLAMGAKRPEQMLQQAEADNWLLMWVLRFLSFLLMSGGFVLILKPLAVFVDVIPCLGDLLGLGLGLVAFASGFFLWMLATALAWLTVRPLWALGLLFMILLTACIIFMQNEKKG